MNSTQKVALSKVISPATKPHRRALTPMQQRIVSLLPATTDELAQALYNRVTQYERRLIYVHIRLLRLRLPRSSRLISRRREVYSNRDCRVTYDLEVGAPHRED